MLSKRTVFKPCKQGLQHCCRLQRCVLDPQGAPPLSWQLSSVHGGLCPENRTPGDLDRPQMPKTAVRAGVRDPSPLLPAHPGGSETAQACCISGCSGGAFPSFPPVPGQRLQAPCCRSLPHPTWCSKQEHGLCANLKEKVSLCPKRTIPRPPLASPS